MVPVDLSPNLLIFFLVCSLEMASAPGIVSLVVEWSPTLLFASTGGGLKH